VKTIYTIEVFGQTVASFATEEDRDHIFQNYFDNSHEGGATPGEMRVAGSKEEWRREQETTE
jgi:hypothetical protein